MSQAFSIDLDQGQRDNQEILCTLSAKYKSHLGPKYAASQKPPFRDESKNIFISISQFQ